MPGVLGRLTLQRCEGEKIVIGDSIIVSIEGVGTNCANLKITDDGRIVISEVVQIGTEVTVTPNVSVCVVGTKGAKCRIRTTAPTDIPVHRAEIAAEIAEETAVGSERPDTLSDLAAQIGEVDGFPVGQMYDPDA